MIKHALTLMVLCPFALAQSPAPEAAQQEGAPPAQGARARDPGAARGPMAPFTRVASSIEVLGDLTLRADLSDAPGDVQVMGAGIGTVSTWALNAEWVAQLAVDARGTFYDFNDATTLIPAPPGDATANPFSELWTSTVGGRLIYKASDTLSYIGGAGVTFSGEGGADVGDTMTFGGFGGVQWALNENFKLGLGAAVSSRLERSAQVLPFVSIEWKASENISVSTRGPGLRVANKLSDAATLVLDASYQSPEYRLSDEGPLASGIIKDTRVPVTVGVVWTPAPRWQVTLKAGAVVYQEFKVYDRDGNELRDLNTRPAPVVMLGVEWSF
jgi:hypothetical protein